LLKEGISKKEVDSLIPLTNDQINVAT